MIGDEIGGILFIGSKGKIMTGCYGRAAILLLKSDMELIKQPEPSILLIYDGCGDIWYTNVHEQNWIRACKETPENRLEASSNFSFSVPFDEMVMMGVLVIFKCQRFK